MPKVELISVHIPKTAGTSFRVLLESVYGADGIHLVYPTATDVPSDLTDHEIWLADSLALCRLDSSGPRVVHGHFRLDWYADRFPQAPRIAWLRHPVDRLISFFYMWQEMPLWPTASPLQKAVRAGQVDLLGFARSPAMRDQATRRFLGSPDAAGLTFIGLQERFDDDLRSLADILHWPTPDATRVNVNDSAGYASRKIAPDLRDQIAGLNPADMDLYHDVLHGRWQGRPRDSPARA